MKKETRHASWSMSPQTTGVRDIMGSSTTSYISVYLNSH